MSRPSHQRWLDELRNDLVALDAAHLRRRLVAVHRAGPDSENGDNVGRLIRREGSTLINFASNDYLALADHPALKTAAKDAIDRYGAGAGASRLVTGHLAIHGEIERRFAAFKHAEAALLCPTGYLANLAVLTTLARPGDLICIDKLCHASLIDAAQASGATVRVFPHLNYEKLRRLLERGSEKTGQVQLSSRKIGPVPFSPPRKIGPVPFSPPLDHGTEADRVLQPVASEPGAPRSFIVTDSIFSMDGDAADLPSLCDLAEEFSAILIVDEAHGTGVFGETGAGLCEEQGVSDRVDVVISTASKALGGLGGIVTAKQVVIDTFINHARSFIFTTAVPAAQAAAIGAALDVVRDEPWRRQRVLELAAKVRSLVSEVAPRLVPHPPPSALRAPRSALPTSCSPIIPLITGSAESALALAAHLASHGIHAPAIRPPTVAPNSARVRLSLRADMTDDDLTRLREALRTAAV